MEKHFDKAQNLAEVSREYPTPGSSGGPGSALQGEVLLQDHQTDQFDLSPNVAMGKEVPYAHTQSSEFTSGAITLEPGPASLHRSPCLSATFTSTVAGLHPEEGQWATVTQDMCDMIAHTISNGIDAVLYKKGLLGPSQLSEPCQHAFRPSSPLDREYVQDPQSPLPS